MTQGLVAGRYRLGPRLGAGGMGIVYRAVDVEAGRDVAIKLLRPDRSDDEIAKRYLDGESKAIGRVAHHNVVTVLAAGTAEQVPYLVMELVAGEPLRHVLHREGPLPIRRVSAIVRKVLAGVHAIHRAGFVHGDVKADNVLVDETHTTLIDLGLMRPSNSASDGYASGTPEYMAPEVIRGKGSSTQSDLYSVGILLYELLTGATPFAGGTAPQILGRHLDDVVVPPSVRAPDRGIPPAIDRIVLQALAKRPGDRFFDARTFALALAAATPEVEPATTMLPAFSSCADTIEWKHVATRRFARGTRPRRRRSSRSRNLH